jgi:predicted kinase
VTKRGVLAVTIGIPGSGKTTKAEAVLAQQLDPGEVVLVSRDDIRQTLHRTADFSDRTESQVTKVQDAAIRAGLEDNAVVFVHDQNLRMNYRKKYAKIAQAYGAQYVQIDCTDVPLELCLKRNAQRDNPVPEEYIRSQYNKFVKPLKGAKMPYPKVVELPPRREIYVPNPDKPRVVLVDVDGTVALHGGVRGPYDTSRYHLDKPNQAVIDLVQGIQYEQNTGIVFCSGRHEDFRGVTEEWLYENVRVQFSLYMRENHGTRDDVEKLDLFDTYIRDNYYVKFALDDRDRVVKAWRSIGLTCLQVAPGDF